MVGFDRLDTTSCVFGPEAGCHSPLRALRLVPLGNTLNLTGKTARGLHGCTLSFAVHRHC